MHKMETSAEASAAAFLFFSFRLRSLFFFFFARYKKKLACRSKNIACHYVKNSSNMYFHKKKQASPSYPATAIPPNAAAARYFTARRRLRWLWKLETEAPIDCWRCGSWWDSDAWERIRIRRQNPPCFPLTRGSQPDGSPPVSELHEPYRFHCAPGRTVGSGR